LASHHRSVAVQDSLRVSYWLDLGKLPIVGVSDVLEKVRIIVSFLAAIITFV
jgi:hypothetical protein